MAKTGSSDSRQSVYLACVGDISAGGTPRFKAGQAVLSVRYFQESIRTQPKLSDILFIPGNGRWGPFTTALGCVASLQLSRECNAGVRCLLITYRCLKSHADLWRGKSCENTSEIVNLPSEALAQVNRHSLINIWFHIPYLAARLPVSLYFSTNIVSLTGLFLASLEVIYL